MSVNASFNSTMPGSIDPGCSIGTMVGYGILGVVATVGAGGICYVASHVKRKFIEFKNILGSWRTSYQVRNDILLASHLVTAGGVCLVNAIDDPRLKMGIGCATLGLNYALIRSSVTTRPMNPVKGEPLVIHPDSHLYFNAQNCLFAIPTTTDPNPNPGSLITVDSAGAALEIKKISMHDRVRHRFHLENKSAQQICFYYAAHPEIIPLAGFDFGANAKSILYQKYGLSVDGAKVELTELQSQRRSELLTTLGSNPEKPQQLRHPAIPGVPISEDQLSGCLMLIRGLVYAEEQTS